MEKEDKLLDYFKNDTLAANVWQSKYALEGEETPDDMHRRMAKEFARIETSYRRKESLVAITGENFDSLSYYGKHRDE